MRLSMLKRPLVRASERVDLPEVVVECGEGESAERVGDVGKDGRNVLVVGSARERVEVWNRSESELSPVEAEESDDAAAAQIEERHREPALQERAQREWRLAALRLLLGKPNAIA